jgi:phospholipase C
MILVRTDHPYLRVGRHRWYQSHYRYNTSRTVLFLKTYGEEMLRGPYKGYSSLNKWQANWDLPSTFTSCNLLFCNDTPMTR